MWTILCEVFMYNYVIVCIEHMSIEAELFKTTVKVNKYRIYVWAFFPLWLIFKKVTCQDQRANWHLLEPSPFDPVWWISPPEHPGKWWVWGFRVKILMVSVNPNLKKWISWKWKMLKGLFCHLLVEIRTSSIIIIIIISKHLWSM